MPALARPYLAAAVVACLTMASTGPARAGNGDVAAGVAAGLVTGLIIGSQTTTGKSGVQVQVSSGDSHCYRYRRKARHYESIGWFGRAEYYWDRFYECLED
mgnify:CR=1 FL=1